MERVWTFPCKSCKIIEVFENTKGKKEDRLMKMMKKVATLLLAVCLAFPCFSMLTQAKNAIMFEDPSTAVGETLALKGVVELDNNIEDRTVVMTYDTTMLKFKNGDNVTESAPGQLTYSATGEAGGKRAEFLMYFDVLKEGTTKVEVSSHTVFNTSDTRVTCQQGNSTITIAPGEAPAVSTENPTTDVPDTDASTIVDVDGVSYTLSDAFADTDIPQGFVASTIDYDGAERKVVMQESSGLTLGYLVDANGEGNFFVYIADNATFAPYETIEVSESTTIVLLTTIENVVLPETYAETTVTVNGIEFPAWQNAEEPDYCILYAMNQNGEESLYRFDIQEGTYQRFQAPVVEEEKEDVPMFGKLSEMLQNHLDYVILGTGLGFIIFIILIIILSVKLYNRNAELDELYDEYGIDLDDEEESDSEDDMIINIDDEDDVEFEEVEEDVVFEDVEEIDEVEEIEEVESEEINEEVAEAQVAEEPEAEPEILLQDEPEEDDREPVDDIKSLQAALQADEEYLDDDEELDFEMDFIDLDD